MKLQEVKKDESQEQITIDTKGKISYLEPSRKGTDGCPFWVDVKNKIAKTDKAHGQVRIPKAFIADLAKKFKVKLHDSHNIPLCVKDGAVCAFFNGSMGDEISCNYGKKPQEEQPMQQEQPAKQEGSGTPSTPGPAAVIANPAPTSIAGTGTRG